MNINEILGIDEAIGADVRAYAGSGEELSRRVFGSPSALRHKLARYKGQYFKPEDLVMLMLITGSRETVKAIAHNLDGVFLQLPPIDADIGQEELEQQCMALTMRLGELFAEMTKSLEDGVIEGHERLALEAKAHEVRAAISSWLQLSYRVYEEPNHE